MEMRTVLGETLEKLMEKDQRIVVIDADLARADGTLPLRKRFPDRAFDVGVAEQNMAGIAAGLSSHGFIPFITSFAPFASRRICDQAAISIAYAKRNVKIVGTDPGLTAELNGGTHMGIEDMGVLRSTPTMILYEPSDPEQLAQALPQIIAHKGPVYIRLHRKEVPNLHAQDYQFDLFKADILKKGENVTIATTGAVMVKQALQAAELLAEKGIQAEVLEIHTVKPIDVETLVASVKKTGAIVTAENHNVVGGLCSAVSEALAQNWPTPLKAVGIQDVFGEVGKLPELLEKFQMTAKDIVLAAEQVLKMKKM